MVMNIILDWSLSLFFPEPQDFYCNKGVGKKWRWNSTFSHLLRLVYRWLDDCSYKIPWRHNCGMPRYFVLFILSFFSAHIPSSCLKMFLKIKGSVENEIGWLEKQTGWSVKKNSEVHTTFNIRTSQAET